LTGMWIARVRVDGVSFIHVSFPGNSKC
jgi:hypothetical protein